jgi:hypothetical protein
MGFDEIYPLVNKQFAIENSHRIYVVDLPINNGDFPLFFVCLPEGNGDMPCMDMKCDLPTGILTKTTMT